MDWYGDQSALVHVIPLDGKGPVRTFRAPNYFTCAPVTSHSYHLLHRPPRLRASTSAGGRTALSLRSSDLRSCDCLNGALTHSKALQGSAHGIFQKWSAVPSCTPMYGSFFTQMYLLYIFEATSSYHSFMISFLMIDAGAWHSRVAGRPKLVRPSGKGVT